VTLSFNHSYRYILFLILLNILLLVAGCLLRSVLYLNLLREIITLSTLFSVISVITLVIFFRGQTRESDSQTLHTLFSISLKFLLDMILALFWFYVAKKTSLTSVFMFFVIYLTLTLFSIFVILKTLKSRSLKNYN
jgi:hypothetical protein